MKIREKDIFKFVFYPLELSSTKKEFISNNYDKFATQIKAFENVRDNSVNVDEKLFEEFQSKSKNFGKEPRRKFLEKRVSNNQLKKNDTWKFAADSMTLNKKIITETFMDSDSKYLLKLLVSNELTKLFLFSHDNSQLKNMKVTLYPSGDSYIMKDNSKPLEINGEIVADSITIETSI